MKLLAELGLDAERRAALENALPEAIAVPDQLFPVYQPRIDLSTSACVCVETLLRWRHPIFGLVSPGEFIPLAENDGLMAPLTSKVFALAFDGLDVLTASGHAVDISVNISASVLEDEGFVPELQATIARRGLAPQRIELEFTEGVLIEDVPSVREKLASLVELGLTLAIDDFGAGTSNLSYLRDLPMTVLKIDRAFVRELADNQRDQIIVRSILSLAHALGYRVIAEGVETAQALELLKSWGCDEAQGFFICKPIPLAELLPWLEAQKAAQS